MPRESDLDILIESDIEHFKGQNPMNYQTPGRKDSEQFKGEVIGTIEVDPKTKEIKINVEPKNPEV